jgi:two-component system response regulator DesR
MIRVLLIEDRAMIRGALVALLQGEDDLHVVAAVGRADEIMPAAWEAEPDVAVFDIDVPGLDGITAAEQLRDRLPNCAVLVLADLAQAGILRRAMDGRISGYLRKDAPAEQLANAIRKVASGRSEFCPKLARAAQGDGLSPLSLREAEILRLTAEGAGPQEVAMRLRLSTGTVRNHLTMVVCKLQARNQLDAVRIAGNAGWLNLGRQHCCPAGEIRPPGSSQPLMR